WFVELLRRFSLTCSLLTPQTPFKAADGNPFSGDQLFIVAGSMLDEERHAAGILEAAWDLVIVDEVHHLHHGTRTFTVLSLLAKKQCGLILLSATPEQLGRKDHFYRLQLLDPERYPSWREYENEMEQWRAVSKVIEELEWKGAGEARSPEMPIVTLPPSTLPGQTTTVALTLDELIDLYGTGRAVFRNTRRNVAGFPGRIVDIARLECSGRTAGAVAQEFLDDMGGTEGERLKDDDPRVAWLVAILKKYRDEKILVLCTTRKKAEALRELLLAAIRMEIALFHEEMTIIQRDRQAAWFAKDNGARALICSEAGSEGRNFQFCRHLALFDLPTDPELLAQRIGRLDRIGQKAAIHIHVPSLIGTVQEIVCRWHHEGLGTFAANVPAAGRVYEEVGDELALLLREDNGNRSAAATAFLEKSRALCARYARQITDARDRLLELASCNQERARKLIDDIQRAHRSGLAQRIATLLFKHYGIVAEEGEPRTFILNTEYLTDHSFPLPRAETPVVTFDPSTALVREEVEFLTIDHPLVRDGLALFLSGGRGSSVIARSDAPEAPPLLLEAVYIVECIAPAHLQSNRFLPPEPITVRVDHTLRDRTAELEHAAFLDRVKAMRPIPGLDEKVKPMLEQAASLATLYLRRRIEEALGNIDRLYCHEIERSARLRGRSGLNPGDETAYLEEQRRALTEHVGNARVRLDALRVVVGRS
ncbi:MAG: hypothetical protein JXA71_10125, partial [Chitinispirillaceae bacterium]|nr:hypothetical protein [Chitinispirillaceae bacterium]